MKKLLLLILPTLLLASCKKDDINPPVDAFDKGNPTYEYIKKLGFRDSEIKDIGNDYLVEGDILFAKNSHPDFSIFGGPKTEQYGTSNYVGFNLQPNITVRIDPSMAAFVNEINGAIAMWNSINNFRVQFTLTNATDQNILITNEGLGLGTCGIASWPMNGRPGNLIRINGDFIAGNDFLQRQRTIAHELGHSIGFRHTNVLGTEPKNTGGNNPYVDAMNILGTPTGADPNSLMNSNECGIGATALSNFDIVAAQFLYPANPPVAGTVPVFRYYYRSHHQKHFYTTNYNELGDGNNADWIFEGIGFFAFPNQVDQSVPVYRYYSPSTLDHFYTTNFGTLGGGRGGYYYEFIAFFAYPAAFNGSQPVQKYYASGGNDHFYTLNPNEFTFGGMGGYVFEETAFFAY